MAETDDYLRMLLDQAAAEEAFLERVGSAEDAELASTATMPATSPAVSLMITIRQRAELRELGFFRRSHAAEEARQGTREARAGQAAPAVNIPA